MPARATVRVHADTREQLRKLADSDETTMPNLIADLAQRELDRRMIAQHVAAFEAMTAEERADYRAELTAWDATLMDGLRDDPYPLLPEDLPAR
jgi:hypothetical protein